MDELIELLIRKLNAGSELDTVDRIEGEPAIGLEHDGVLYFLTIDQA